MYVESTISTQTLGLWYVLVGWYCEGCLKRHHFCACPDSFVSISLRVDVICQAIIVVRVCCKACHRCTSGPGTGWRCTRSLPPCSAYDSTRDSCLPAYAIIAIHAELSGISDSRPQRTVVHIFVHVCILHCCVFFWYVSPISSF